MSMGNPWAAPPYGVGPGARSTQNSVTVTGTVTTDEVVPTSLKNGSVTVVTAGTRVALASTTAVEWVVVKAKAANAGKVYVGNSTVSSANGLELSPGEQVTLSIADLATVYVDAATNGDKVTYIAA